MDFIVIETQSLTDSIGITILVEIDSMGDENIVFGRSEWLNVLIFFRGSSMGWAAPSDAQFFNSVMALTMVVGF